jgi:hypothetical protein
MNQGYQNQPPVYFGQGGASPPENPYSSGPMPGYPAPQNRGSGWKVMLYLFSGMGILAMLGCCGMCGGIFYVANNEFTQQAQQLQTDYAAHPVVQRELGGLSKVEHSWLGTVTEEADDDLVFDAVGPQGKGKIIVTEKGFDDEPSSIRLRTKNGEWELLEDAP